MYLVVSVAVSVSQLHRCREFVGQILIIHVSCPRNDLPSTPLLLMETLGQRLFSPCMFCPMLS